MDGMIQTSRFGEFVREFANTVNEENEDKTTWEFFLHKVFDGSFADFKADIERNRQIQEMSQQEIDDTIKHSMDILNNFKPSEED